MSLIYISKLLDGNLEYVMHSHPSWELIYFTEGQGSVVTEHESIPFSSGTVVCIPPDMLHGDIADGRYKNIHLNTEVPLCNTDSICSFRDNSSRDLLQLLELTFSVFMQTDIRYKELCRSLFGCIEQYISLMCTAPEAEYDPDVYTMTRRILENLSDPDFQIDLCFEGLAFSPDHLRRLFKRKHGCSLRAFLVKQRVELAKRLLRENDRVSHVAAMVGFSDPYYFSRVFKEETGLSPSAYKQKNTVF